MSRIIVVERCADCPHQKGWKGRHYCYNTPGVILIPDPDAIPDWCPLPEDLGPSLIYSTGFEFIEGIPTEEVFDED